MSYDLRKRADQSHQRRRKKRDTHKMYLCVYLQFDRAWKKMADVSDPALPEAVRDVRDDHTSTDW